MNLIVPPTKSRNYREAAYESVALELARFGESGEFRVFDQPDILIGAKNGFSPVEPGVCVSRHS